MNAYCRKVLKLFLPEALLKWYRRRKLLRLRARNKVIDTKEVFTKIYANNEWGGEAGTFCSGSGSQPMVAQEYCEMVKEFVIQHKVATVLDLGCGDFNVGKNIQVQGVKYVGVDIVEPLIARNIYEYGSKNIEFSCLDIIKDELPAADLVLLRQVLQHLSNEQILKILKKLENYPFVLVSEHYPAEGGNVIPNMDKPHGSDTRVVDNSGVYLDKPPFNVLVLSTVLDVNACNGELDSGSGERIKTVLLGRATK